MSPTDYNIGDLSINNRMQEKDLVSSDKQQIQFCRHCGEKIEIDSNFCKYCGKKILDSNNYKIEYGRQYIRNKAVKLLQKLSRFLRPPYHTKSPSHIGKIKQVAFFIFILAIVIVICNSIWHYFNNYLTQRKAEIILSKELSELWNLKGDALFIKCEDIIRENIIPKSGNEQRDRDNLNKVIPLAWDRIYSLAEEGHPEAQFLLALRNQGYRFQSVHFAFDKKHGGFKKFDEFDKESPYYDIEKAAYWYLQAAQKNHSAAQNNLGQCYHMGTGVEVNFREAVKWYRLSAENGNSYGQLNLGDCFRDGIKVKVSERWEKESDSYYYNWNTKSGYHLVDEYETLLKQDLDSAKFYWQASALQGNEIAKERLQKIY